MGEIGEMGETGVMGRVSCRVVGTYRYESTGRGNGGEGIGVLYGLLGGLS